MNCPKEFSKRLGDSIRRLRVNTGLSVAELAEYLDVTMATLSRYENGERCQNAYMVNKIALYFNRTIEELIKGENI